MPNPPRIWLTRPLEDSSRFAHELIEHGVESLIAPVLHIVPLPLLALPATPTALLLTSRHAAHALASLPTVWRGLPIYCVGSATAHVATEHGFTHIIPSSSNVLALLPRMSMELGSGAHILYLAGNEVSVDVGRILSHHDISVSTCVAYRAVASHTLNDAAKEALAEGTLHGVALFSPRSAEITHSLLVDAGLVQAATRLTAFCFSQNVANAASKTGWAAVHSCTVPTRLAMRELIVSQVTKTL